MTRWFVAFVTCFLASLPAGAEERVRLWGDFMQGGLLMGRAPPGTALMLEERYIPMARDGHFTLGLERDAPAELTLHIRYPGGREAERVIPVRRRDYDIQRIDGVPPRYVEPPYELVTRLLREIRMVRFARASYTDARHYSRPFSWPATGRISGVYGSQRVYNGEPRRPHFGVDIAVPAGTPVQAPADGRVTLTHHLYFAGKTVILDHGHGVFSTYIHLRDILVDEGQAVRRGDIIGRVGTTGRTTGPHLHWGLNWFEVALDPALLAGPMPGGDEAGSPDTR